MEEEIINKVAESGLVTIDLEDFYTNGIRTSIDISEQLVEGLLLREKDFRAYVKEHNWSQYNNQYINIFCSTEAVIPQWAWMLLATALQPHAQEIVFGTPQTLEEVLYRKTLQSINVNTYLDKRVVIKGCSGKPVPASAYAELTVLLKPVVKSILYGEPCSTVPVYKRKD
jgi:hypothetical protein